MQRWLAEVGKVYLGSSKLSKPDAYRPPNSALLTRHCRSKKAVDTGTRQKRKIERRELPAPSPFRQSSPVKLYNRHASDQRAFDPCTNDNLEYLGRTTTAASRSPKTLSLCSIQAFLKQANTPQHIWCNSKSCSSMRLMQRTPP